LTRIQRMISLCEKTNAIASRMGNFSGWVRTMLLRDAGQNMPAAVDLSSRQLLAIVLTRNQLRHGYDTPIVKDLLDLLKYEDLD